MKITGGRSARFLSNPPDDLIGALFFGPDRGLVKDRARALAEKFIDNPDDAFSSTVFTADDLQSDPARFSDEMVALSLLGDARLVRVRLDHERPGAALAKAIKRFDTNPGQCAAKLIIEAGDLTPRSALRKAFEAAGHFAAIGCYAASLGDIANFIRTELDQHGIRIDREALDLWTPLLQGDQGLMRGEVEKMALYKGYGQVPNAEISVTDIKTLAAGGQVSSIDDIIMTALSGQPDTCNAAFERAMAGKINAAVILRSLQRHLARLLEARAHMNKGDSPEAAMRALRPPVFRMQERTFASHLRIWPTRALQRALSQSIDADMSIKTAGSPAQAITGRLLLALSQYAKRRA